MRCDHYCNEPLRCPECNRRFWRWAENHTRHDPNGFIVAALTHPPLPTPEERPCASVAERQTRRP
jgi:hypothetical protein